MIGHIVWDKDRPMTKKINGYIEKLRENFETNLDCYFDEFKRKIKNRMIIPMSMIDQYYDHICFMADIDYTYAQAVIPKVAWLRPMQYEFNVDEVSTTITPLLAEAIDKNVELFNI